MENQNTEASPLIKVVSGKLCILSINCAQKMISDSSDEEDSDDNTLPGQDTKLIMESLPVPARFVDSPTPSLISDFEEQTDELERKEKLMLYVFVLRCIAYPFNAKQQTDVAKRQTKICKQELSVIKARFDKFLSGQTDIESDKAFHVAVKCYYDTFLCSDRVVRMLGFGCCTANDFREVFKRNIEKRVRNVPNGLTIETILNSWMAKFDSIYRGEERLSHRSPARMAGTTSEMVLSKDQLYEMFQTILGVKKYEHAILYNACQVCWNSWLNSMLIRVCGNNFTCGRYFEFQIR